MVMLRRFFNRILNLSAILILIVQLPALTISGSDPVEFGDYINTGSVLSGGGNKYRSYQQEGGGQPAAPTSSAQNPGWEPATLTLDLALPEAAPAAAQLEEITNGWTTIMSENFDGTFPHTLWSLVDGNGATGGNIYWGKETYLHRSGNYSMWAAGTNGPDPAAGGYSADLLAYMIYGPFNTIGAQGVSLTFSYWNHSEPEDTLWAMVSTDPNGENWSGWRNTITNTEGWRTVSFDLGSISDLQIANQPIVRIAFIFYSDGQNTTPDIEKGPFIDDVVLEKISGADLTWTTPDNPVNPWDGPIIASSGPNTHQTTSPLYTHQNTYIDWAVINQGVAAEETFTNCLYLQDRLITCLDLNGLAGGGTATFDDILMNITPPYGWITLKVVIDAANNVDEFDETNNIIEKEFLWLRPGTPDLLPHTPAGWSYPVTPASVTGTTTFFTLRSGTSTYVDWAVINLSETTVTADFDTCLYLDNTLLECWRVTTDLGAGVYYYRLDRQYSAPSPGQHTLSLFVDAKNEVAEANESNNIWQRTFTWYLPNYCGPFTSQTNEASAQITNSWITRSLELPPGPEGAILNEVSLKIAIDHPYPEQLEIFISHEGNPDKVRVNTAGLDFEDGKELMVTFKDFAGQPARGEWLLWLHDPQPGRTGRLISASITAIPFLPGQTADLVGMGHPAAFQLPDETPLIQLPPGIPAENTIPQTTAPNLTPGWTQILYETFEQSFPSSNGWSLEDRQVNDGCQYLWDEDNSDHSPTNGGQWSGWPAGGGQNGLDPTFSYYPPNMDSWMIFGPFDLSNASDARLSFDLKRDMEAVHDYLFVGASDDRSTFSGQTYSGRSGWVKISQKLTQFAGKSTVWIGFRFVSDPSSQSYGPRIDNILVEKAGGLYCSNGLAEPALTAQQLLDAYQAAHDTARPTLANEEPYQISLQSRQFTPDPGIDPAFMSPGRKSKSGWQHLLVQFYETPHPEQIAELSENGIKLLQYLPDRAWIASVNRQKLGNLNHNPAVRWIGPLEPADRFSPVLRSPSVQAMIQGSPQSKMALVVELADDVPLEAGQALVREIDGTVQSVVESTNTLLIVLPAYRLGDLAQIDEVIWVELPLPTFDPLNDCVRERTGANILQGMPYGLDGSGVDLLVYDAAIVSTSHPAFNGRLVIGDNNPKWDQSYINHATHVAGTAAGNGYGSPIGRDLKGIAPGVRIISYGFQSFGTDSTKFLYTDPGDIESDWRNARVLYGADLGTSSIGSNVAANNYDCSLEGDYGAVSQLIDGIVRGSLGSPYIATWAAGNERGDGRCGSAYNTTPPPSNAKNPIHVGATNSDSDSIAFFSSFGPSDDGRVKPTIVAPGDELYGDGSIMSTWPPGTYYGMYGTSMSAPAVAGLIALMIEQYRLVYNTSGTPLPSTIKALLIHTAVDRGNPGPDYQYGYGRVDGVKAVNALTHGDFLESGFTATGQVHNYTVNVNGAEPELRVSLAWDDAPASLAASIQLVNNLDLTVISPDGKTVYQPFILDKLDPSKAATTGIDNLNNQEQVIVPNPAEGAWTIRVQASNLPVAPQTYSLVFENAQTDNPVPVLETLLPDKLFVGAQNAVLTLNGSGFINLSRIFWNDNEVNAESVTYLSPNQLRISISPAWLDSVGTASIRVVNPIPGGGQSDSRTVQIIPPLKNFLPFIRH